MVDVVVQLFFFHFYAEFLKRITCIPNPIGNFLKSNPTPERSLISSLKRLPYYMYDQAGSYMWVAVKL